MINIKSKKMYLIPILIIILLLLVSCSKEEIEFSGEVINLEIKNSVSEDYLDGLNTEITIESNQELEEKTLKFYYKIGESNYIEEFNDLDLIEKKVVGKVHSTKINKVLTVKLTESEVFELTKIEHKSKELKKGSGFKTNLTINVKTKFTLSLNENKMLVSNPDKFQITEINFTFNGIAIKDPINTNSDITINLSDVVVSGIRVEKIGLNTIEDIRLEYKVSEFTKYEENESIFEYLVEDDGPNFKEVKSLVEDGVHYEVDENIYFLLSISLGKMEQVKGISTNYGYIDTEFVEFVDGTLTLRFGIPNNGRGVLAVSIIIFEESGLIDVEVQKDFEVLEVITEYELIEEETELNYLGQELVFNNRFESNHQGATLKSIKLDGKVYDENEIKVELNKGSFLLESYTYELLGNEYTIDVNDEITYQVKIPSDYEVLLEKKYEGQSGGISLKFDELIFAEQFKNGVSVDGVTYNNFEVIDGKILNLLGVELEYKRGTEVTIGEVFLGIWEGSEKTIKEKVFTVDPIIPVSYKETKFHNIVDYDVSIFFEINKLEEMNLKITGVTIQTRIVENDNFDPNSGIDTLTINNEYYSEDDEFIIVYLSSLIPDDFSENTHTIEFRALSYKYQINDEEEILEEIEGDFIDITKKETV